MKVTPYPTKVKHFRKWRTNVIDADDIFTFLTVKNGRSVDTGVKAVLVIRTKGKKTVTHGAAIPKGWEKVYHGHCRVEIERDLKGETRIVRCI